MTRLFASRELALSIALPSAPPAHLPCVRPAALAIRYVDGTTLGLDVALSGSSGWEQNLEELIDH